MTARRTANPRLETEPDDAEWRRRLLGVAAAVTILALLHHADHVIRGNHSGWPFKPEVTPFTFSLGIYLLLLSGLYLTAGGRLGPGYWLATAVVLFAIVAWVHFGPQEDAERPLRDIYDVYASPVASAFALLVVFAIPVALVVLVYLAIRAREAVGRW